MSLEQILREHAPSIALAASLAMTTAKYGPVAWKAIKQMIRLVQALEAISALPSRMDSLIKEVRPNGGTSLRDAIDKTAFEVSRLSIAVDELGIKHETRWTLVNGVASWESDRWGRCRRANGELCAMLGVSESDIIGNNWKNIIDPADQERVFREWNSIVEEQRDFKARTRYVTANDEMIDVCLKAHAMKRGDEIIGWIGTAERI